MYLLFYCSSADQLAKEECHVCLFHHSPLFALFFQVVDFILSTVYVLSVYVVVLAASL
jgi:hypothetical protein